MAREMSLFTSPWCGNPLLLSTLLIHILCAVHSCSGATYKSYDVMGDLVCNRFHKRERTVTIESPILVESRPNTIANLTAGPAISCDFEAEAKGAGHRLGVIAVVQRMKFRSQGDSCVDYIQSIYHKKKGFKVKHKKKDLTRKIIKKIITGDRHRRDSDGDDDDTGPRICGDVLFGLHVDDNSTLPPPFAAPLPPLPPTQHSLLHSIVSDAMRVNPYRTLSSDAADVEPRGELQIHFFLSNRPLRINENIDIRIAYTAYQECDGRSVPADLFHCGYGVCISSSLVNDGIVNCPFGDCIDETNCTNAKDSNVTAHIVKYSPAKSSETSNTWTKIIVVFIVCCIVAICGGAYYFMKKRKQQKKANVSEEQDNEDDDDGEGKQQPNAGDYYPPPPPGVPVYTPPPGVQPGYYPLQQPPPPPGYSTAYPQLQDTAMGQGLPPPQQGYPPPVGYMPPQPTGPPASYPSYPTPGYPGAGPPPPSGDAPLYPMSAPMVQQQPPAPQPPSGPVGFTYPPPGSGYPQYPPSTGDAGPPPIANI